ncbi:MAG: hypothetical protein ABSG80_09735 [Verrucomicrobiota bacterium]|jgi:hypothetical protein
MDSSALIRSRTGMLLLSATLMVGAVIAWLVLGPMKARREACDFAGQLQAAIAQQQAHTVEKLLERVRTEKRLLNAGIVKVAVADAGTFLLKEHALLKNYEAAFANIPQKITGDPDAAQLAVIASQLAAVRNALNALAPDLKTDNEPGFQAFETQWQKFLSQNSTAVNNLLDQWVAAAEKQCNALDYRSRPEKIAAPITALSGLVRKINDCESEFTNHLSLRGDLLERSIAVRARLAAFDREFKKLDDGMAALSRAGTVKEFSGGINLIASSEFSNSPPAAAASAVQSLEVSDETILRILLGATNADAWACLGRDPGRFVPETVMPAERLILQQLNNDPAISSNHWHYRLWLDPDGTQTQDWITVGPFYNTLGWKQIKAWSPARFSTTVQFQDRDYGCFDGQYRLSPTQLVYRLEDFGHLQETAAFYSVGLEKVLSGNNSYAIPLLEVLDSIKDSREGSPLFRAWLFLRLTDLMNLQPAAWGLDFCPAARAAEVQIEKITGGRLDSGDWFNPARVNSCGKKLEQFFDSEKSVSYAKQAVGLFALARAAAQSGLRYAGFVGLDGKLNFVGSSAPEELWGYNSSHNQPVLLALKAGADSFQEPAMPLSPLFAFERPRKEFLANAGVNPEDPCFRDVLPPLFRTSTRKQP